MHSGQTVSRMVPFAAFVAAMSMLDNERSTTAYDSTYAYEYRRSISRTDPWRELDQDIQELIRGLRPKAQPPQPPPVALELATEPIMVVGPIRIPPPKAVWFSFRQGGVRERRSTRKKLRTWEIS